MVIMIHRTINEISRMIKEVESQEKISDTILMRLNILANRSTDAAPYILFYGRKFIQDEELPEYDALQEQANTNSRINSMEDTRRENTDNFELKISNVVSIKTNRFRNRTTSGRVTV